MRFCTEIEKVEVIIFMKIGFCYDTKGDYGYAEDNLEYTDFVSLHTISEIGKAIEQNGYELEYIGNVYKLRDQLVHNTFNCDLIFNIAEGFGSRNREAILPSLLELYQIPHTASDTYGMSINLNKHHTKILANSIDIPTPKGVCFNTLTEEIINKIPDLGFPFILKPNTEGGSMGLHLIRSMEEFIQQSNYLIKTYSFELLAEEYIEGSEITVPIIGNGEKAEALGVVTILNEDGTDINLYNNSLKQIDNVINTTTFKYGDELKKKIMDYSVRIHNFFGLYDYSRMDFRISQDGQPYFLEINAMPSLCRDCSFEQCGKLAGMTYYQIIGRIIESARIRYGI